MLKKILEGIRNTDYKELEYNGWEIYSSNHGLERDLQRIKLSPKDFDKILKEMILFFDHCGRCKNTEYLVYSRKLQQGMIIELLDDNKIKIVTILPPKRQKISDKEAWKTQKIFVENFENKFYDEDLTEYAILNDDIFRVDEANNWISIDKPVLILEDGVIY